MKTLGSALLLGTLLISTPVFAETQTYVMPDGSNFVVDVPPGMTYTKERALQSWQAEQKAKAGARMSGDAAMSNRSSTYSSDQNRSQIAIMERQQYQSDMQKARDIYFEREQTKNERLKQGMDHVQYGDYRYDVTVRRR